MSREELVNVTVALSSAKKKDRVASLERIQNLLLRNDILNILCSNKESDIISWNTLFIRVHNAVLLDVDNANTKNTSLGSKQLQVMEDIIANIGRKSIYEDVPLLNCDTIVCSTMSVFETHFRIKCLGSVYTDLLSKYILGHRKYWGEIKLEQWIEIKDVCKMCFKNPPPKTQGVVYLDALSDVIRLSCKHVPISQNLLDLFSFVSDIFHSHKDSYFTFDVSLLKLINTLCLQLAIEFRYKVCAFMEDIFECVLGLYDKKNSKNPLVYHFFITYLNIHNPNGVSERNESFYAFDTSKWKNQVMTIYLLTQEASKKILRGAERTELEMGFMDLIVEVNHLVFICGLDKEIVSSNMEIDEYMDGDIHSKKRKRSIAYTQISPLTCTTFSNRSKQMKRESSLSCLVQGLQSSDVWFWLIFLELLLQKYPQSIKIGFKQFVEVLCKLLYDSAGSRTAEVVCRCISIILAKKNCYVETMTETEKQQMNEIWQKIALELIRLLQINGSPEYHRVIRSLIINSVLPNPSPLIELYVKGKLSNNTETFQTLLTLCQNCRLPGTIPDLKLNGDDEHHEQIRSFFLNWLFEERIRFPAKEFSKLVVTLILTKSEEENDIPLTSTGETLIISKNINDFCKLITSTYATISLKNLKFIENAKTNDVSYTPKMDIRLQTELFSILDNRFKELNNELLDDNLSFDVKVNTVKDSVHHCEFLLHFYTYLMKFNVEVKQWDDQLEKMKTLLFLSTSKSYQLLQDKPFSLACFVNLYSSNYHSELNEIIRGKDSVHLGFLQHLFNAFKERSFDIKGEIKTENDIYIKLYSGFSNLISNPKSILHKNILNEKEKQIIEVVELLCHFAATVGSREKNQFQKTLERKLFEELMGVDSLNFNSNFNLQLVFTIIYIFSKFDGLDPDTLNKNVKLLSLIFESRKSDSEISIVILQLMKELILVINRRGNEECELNFITLIRGFRDLIIIKKKCGVGIIMKYIEFLSEMVKMEWRGKSMFEKSSGEIYQFSEEIILFLRHPCYQVRLFSAQTVGSLFTPSEKMTDSGRQCKLMSLLKNKLRAEDNEDVDDILVLPYYQVVRMSVSLISWASIACLSSYWRRSVLYWILQEAHIKKYNRDKVQTIITIICNELKVKDEETFIFSHLSYLINKWAEAGYELEEFPCYIFKIITLEEFLSKYLTIVLPPFLWHGHYNVAEKVSERLKRDVKQVLQDCYPEFMAIVLPSLSENIAIQTGRSASNLKNFIDKKLQIDSFDLMSVHIHKIIYRMFYYIEDKIYLNDLCETQGYLYEECKAVRFTVSQISEALENISPKQKSTLMGEIALERPSVVQKVLIFLVEDVERASIADDKLHAFYKYVAFVEVLTKTTRQSTFRNIATFVMRDIIHTLVSFIRSCVNRKMKEAILKCLQKLLRNYILEFSDILNEFLNTITIMCKPLALEGFKEALEILKFLICDNCGKLYSAISTLDPFPNETIFEEINNMLVKRKREFTSLEEIMRNFLEVAKKKKCDVEALKHLRLVLTLRKKDLKEMFDDLKKLRGFSEDCNNSLIHQLICTLIELTGYKNMLMRTEAAKCLGEIGPLDLTTLVLRPENHYAKDKRYEQPIYRLLKSCVKDAVDLLIHENLDVKIAASDLMYIILSTNEGSRIVKEEPKIMHYLLPFLSSAGENLCLKSDVRDLQQNMNLPNLWSPKNYNEWVVILVVQLLKSFTDNCGLTAALIKMAQINPPFAERILPIILDVILSLGNSTETEIVTTNVQTFFEEYFECAKSQSTLNLSSLHCMVNVVDYIRIQRNYEGIHDQLNLKINYLHIAEAARLCSAFYTAILYIELWFNEKKKLQTNLSIDNLCELYPEEGSILTKILRDCYSKIGIYDGIRGCGYAHLLDIKTESQHYEHLNKWNASMLFHDIELSRGSRNSERHLISAFQKSGMLYTVNSLIQSSSNKHELSDVQYKCAADLGDWSLFDGPHSYQGSEESYEKHHYLALKAFHSDDPVTFQNEIHRARKITVSKLSLRSLESAENLYQSLTELRCLKELEDFAIAVKGNVGELETQYLKWRLQDSIKYSDFRLIERILTQRITVIKEEVQRAKDPETRKFLHNMLSELYYKITKMARREKQFETAIRNLISLSHLENLPDEMIGKIKLEKSLLEWETGDINVGKFLLCHYLKRDEIRGNLRAKALRIYGDWMASTNSENSKYIIEQYYKKSIEVSEKPKDRVNSYASLARFADSNYEQIKEYLASPLFEIKKNITNRQQDMASELRQEIDWNQDREKKMAYRVVERQSVIDENEIRNSENEKDLFLCLAVKYYLLSLKEGEEFDMLVFRLISLWFSNPDHTNVMLQLKEHLSKIPMHKFLCLLPQIVPRVDEIGLISTLVEQCLKDHPYHTMPILFALANSFEDTKYGGAQPASYPQRVLIARALLEKFKKDPKMKQPITEMTHFCDALIELANTSPGEVRGKAGLMIKIPSKLKISRLKNLHFVAVPSLTIPCQKTCNYDNVIGIKCFEDQYQLVGGINIPKKMNCIGLDGKSHPLLVKGRDDLRQDAVMQQVFNIMNNLLHRNSDANRRKLVIRTYKVVPLSHRSGIIEWCENTQPLSLYLIGSDGMSGAHERFNPGDITALECRSRIKKAFDIADVTNDVKLKVFLDICERFRPAFRHFFFEKFPEPGIWFERRLAYTHSVATSSMIGYILGIGDRHVHNILIDNSTAEVIHIDLGIAFEQGKTLPTPETVPFRLTRDIVDGMGISGVEGVFRLSCIKTMKVLRENHHTLLTLLEVLLYDPLYAWTITAEKAYSVQGHAGTESSSEKNSSEIEINKMAERALIRLKQKLQGTETGGVATNTEGQVNYLIQQARDPNNLCRLFHGWQAYL